MNELSNMDGLAMCWCCYKGVPLDFVSIVYFMEDYYKLLEVTYKATTEEIKKRCQELLLKV